MSQSLVAHAVRLAVVRSSSGISQRRVVATLISMGRGHGLVSIKAAGGHRSPTGSGKRQRLSMQPPLGKCHGVLHASRGVWHEDSPNRAWRQGPQATSRCSCDLSLPYDARFARIYRTALSGNASFYGRARQCLRPPLCADVPILPSAVPRRRTRYRGSTGSISGETDESVS